MNDSTFPVSPESEEESLYHRAQRLADSLNAAETPPARSMQAIAKLYERNGYPVTPIMAGQITVRDTSRSNTSPVAIMRMKDGRTRKFFLERHMLNWLPPPDADRYAGMLDAIGRRLDEGNGIVFEDLGTYLLIPRAHLGRVEAEIESLQTGRIKQPRKGSVLSGGFWKHLVAPVRLVPVGRAAVEAN